MAVIGLVTDSIKMPNLALMKLSAYHKEKGDIVDWYNPLFSSDYNKVYYSKIFTFTKHYPYFINNIEKGGTGFNIYKTLSHEIDILQPDYSIYPDIDYAVGFLTRGCIRKCKWCVVPEKEGYIKSYRTVEQIARTDSNKIVFLDNNVLASDFGIGEIEKLSRSDYYIDFNQGLDVRLVTDEIADLLVKINWIKYIRFSCDTTSILPKIIEVAELLRSKGYKKDIFVYVLGIEPEDTLYRLNELKKHKITPFMQPYRDLSSFTIINPELRKMARWCNRKWLFKSCSYEEYNDKKRKYPLKYEDTIKYFLELEGEKDAVI
ncbi:radical SAM protein [uncultured Brachyspira sp.]|uniref:radical SAM protein n=1 Tax=uncultured Brachyspira sp. TaxID=221953 RepID=UPI002615FE79|nr:radical SAM protein [uncultured Brachyspira sp.]